MATYVNDLRLKEIATGDSSGTWGTETNVNLELIGEAMGYATKAVADASTSTITMPDGTATNGELRSLYLKLTGGGQASTITLAPNTVSKVWFIENATSYTLTFTQGSGANVAVLAGQTKAIASDGAGSGAVLYDVLTDLSVGGDFFVANTIQPAGDTASGDAAAIGYTSAEGIIVTGQGSTSDVTLKNDADGTVLTIPTGTTNVDVVGDFTAGTLNADGDTAAGDAAAIGYTSAEGIILTGQGSTSDVTIKNDADGTVLTVPTGTTNVDIVGVATAATFEPDGDTAAGDNAAIGYTSTEGLILTGQGSTNDVTIKNDADADVLEIPTGTVNVTVAGDLVAAGTLQATGDTAAGDDAAIGYTSAEGLILTGQGSTNDVTIKNDADADVLEIPTGTVNVTMAGTVTAVSTIVGNAGLHVKNGATGAGFVQFFEDSDNGTNTVTLAGPASTADITLTLPSSTGNNGEALVTNGSGVLSFAAVGGLYNDWAIKTSAYTMVSGDQIIVNKSSALTMTLPASASAGDTVTIKATGGGTVTIGRNSQNINSVAGDGTLQSGKATQLVFVDSTIGFLEI
tara:strand:+ start:331 stop:2046 length:1716 start_codon:yes stop_codon:yes gene_type:complete